MDLADFKKKPLLGILRGVEAEIIEPLIETVIFAGLKTLEITMNTADAPELIYQAKKVCANRLTLGAGTVLTMQDLKSALGSGASFILLPVLIREVVEYCVKNRIPFFPYAFILLQLHLCYSFISANYNLLSITAPGYAALCRLDVGYKRMLSSRLCPCIPCHSTCRCTFVSHHLHRAHDCLFRLDVGYKRMLSSRLYPCTPGRNFYRCKYPPSRHQMARVSLFPVDDGYNYSPSMLQYSDTLVHKTYTIPHSLSTSLCITLKLIEVPQLMLSYTISKIRILSI